MRCNGVPDLHERSKLWFHLETILDNRGEQRMDSIHFHELLLLQILSKSERNCCFLTSESAFICTATTATSCASPTPIDWNLTSCGDGDKRKRRRRRKEGRKRRRRSRPRNAVTFARKVSRGPNKYCTALYFND
jgi:hypothetical protein